MLFLEVSIPRGHVLTQDSPPSWCKFIKPLIQLLNLTKVHPTLFCVVCYRRKRNPMEKATKNVLFICFKCSTNNHVTLIMFVMWPCASLVACFGWQSMQNSFKLNIHFLVMNLYLFLAIHIYVHLLYDCESLTVFSWHMGPTSWNTQLMESPQDHYLNNYLCKWVSSIDK
jgi:predicted ferric reductase